MGERNRERNDPDLAELLATIRNSPKLRQAILSGLTAAIAAELAVTGLAGVIDLNLLANTGKVVVNDNAFVARGVIWEMEHLDNTSSGGI